MKKVNEEIKVKETGIEIDTEVIAKVSKEEKDALINASSDKKIVKYLVDQYYQSQDYRIVAQNQTRALFQGYDEADREQLIFINKELDNAVKQEALNKKYMDIITDSIPVCKWMKAITGIGPVISAYLYSAFDVKIGTYNTNFLSYAGLNDNNNPWLGTDKAKAMIKDAIEYREEIFNSITKQIEELADNNEKIIKKVNTALKKLCKLEEFTVDDIDTEIVAIIGKRLPSDFDFTYLVDYTKWIADPKHCDDILINYVASETGRNFKNVKKGTINNWDNKKSKSKEPTVDDLISYLAKPPYNTDLKKMMYIVGDMFIRNSGREKSLYGRIYKEKRMEYDKLNKEGAYAEQAAQLLKEKNYSTGTETYKALSEGRLSDAHILARARRYAVKLFISHVFEAMYYAEFHEEPPKTYVIQYMGHHDYIAPEVDYRPFIDGEL